MDSGRFSRHRRLVPIERLLAPLAIAGLALCFCQARAQSPGVGAAPTGADLLREFIDGTRTLRASFRQELLGPDHEVVELATGDLSIKRPGRFCWRYSEPIEQLVVADGTNLWIYDVDLAQATVAPLDQAAASPAMLLSGEADLDAEFDVLESFEMGSLRWVRLAPKLAGTDFSEVLIGFRGGVLSRLQLLDSLEQTTTIEFMDVEVNEDLGDGLFDFVPPAGVDVIGEAG
jgi:outer membrane lipoprotein carrier protein